MKTVNFEEVIVSDSEITGFYTSGPGSRGFTLLVSPTIYHSPALTHCYIVFPGGITAYVDKKCLVGPVQEPVKPVVSGISENTLLKAIAITKDATLALQLIKD